MIRRWLRSLYVQIFLSFLATCVLFFGGLAVFWNYYFTDYFYKGKKELLTARAAEVEKLLPSFQEGTMSIRELRFGIRLIARSINGMVWLVDAKGTVLNGSSSAEGLRIPPLVEPMFAEGLQGHSGFTATQNPFDSRSREGLLVHYSQARLDGEPVVVLLSMPAVELSETITAVRWNILVPLLFSLVAVGLVLFILSRRLAGPLQRMNKAALEVAGGDFSTRVPIASNEEIGELARSFNLMIDQLEQWEWSRQEFLTNVSHELRSPLTTLRGLITGMMDKVIPPSKYDHYLSICNEEVQRLQRLVNDLLDLARIQNGVDVFRLRPVLLNTQMSEALEIIRKPAADKQIALSALIPPEGEQPLVCELDPDRFVQILQNLLYNAIRFTPPEGGVTVELRREGQEAVVYVRDTGIGMSEEELKRIWDRFYKAQASRTTADADGTGLGLTIVKHLVGGMGGHIAVESRLGGGTEFRVAFPLTSGSLEA